MTINIFSPTFAGLSPITDITTPGTIGTPNQAGGSLTVSPLYNTPNSIADLQFGAPLLGTPATIAITPLQSAHQLTVREIVAQHEEAIRIAEEDTVVRALNFINAEAEDSPISNISSEDSDISSSSENLAEVFEAEPSPLRQFEFDLEEMEEEITTDESSDSDGSLKRSRDSDDDISDDDANNKKARSGDSEEESGYVGLTNQDLTDIADFYDNLTTPDAQSFISPESTGSLSLTLSSDDRMNLSGEIDGTPFPFLEGNV
jgi:hypothetical protein